MYIYYTILLHADRLYERVDYLLYIVCIMYIQCMKTYSCLRLYSCGDNDGNKFQALLAMEYGRLWIICMAYFKLKYPKDYILLCQLDVIQEILEFCYCAS